MRHKIYRPSHQVNQHNAFNINLHKKYTNIQPNRRNVCILKIFQVSLCREAVSKILHKRINIGKLTNIKTYFARTGADCCALNMKIVIASEHKSWLANIYSRILFFFLCELSQSQRAPVRGKNVTLRATVRFVKLPKSGAFCEHREIESRFTDTASYLEEIA